MMADEEAKLMGDEAKKKEEKPIKIEPINYEFLNGLREDLEPCRSTSFIFQSNSSKLMQMKVTKMLLQIGLGGIKTPPSKLFPLVTASCLSSLCYQASCFQSVGSREERPTLFTELHSEDTLDLCYQCLLSFQSTTS